MEIYNTSRVVAIHAEIQDDRPNLWDATVKTFRVGISRPPKVGYHLSPMKYTNLGRELGEMMNLGFFDNAMFSNGFGLRIGLNLYAEGLEKIATSHPLLFIYKRTFSKHGVDTAQYNEQQIREFLGEMAQNSPKIGIDSDKLESWLRVCVGSGQTLGTTFLEEAFDTTAVINQMSRMRTEITTLRPPEIGKLFDI